MNDLEVIVKPAHILGVARKQEIIDQPRNFPDALRRSARLFSDKGIEILDRSGKRGVRKSYAELLSCVEKAAGRWRSVGINSGDRILMSVPTSWEFVESWLGAICVGALPAAVAPILGGVSGSGNLVDRLEKYRSVIDADKLVAADGLVDELRKLYPNSLGKIAIKLSEIGEAASDDCCFVEKGPNEAAFLQYTSGSTGMPRAVMIDHGMAMHNAFAIDEGIGRRYGAPASQWAELHNSWLPMHHDMGLIGCLLLALSNGIELSLMNPTTFLARPFRYLEVASGKKAMLSGPNFGYQFCVDRLTPEFFENLDLSQIGVAMTGSEMIRPETMKAFCDLAAPSGFTPDKIMPCYGMAEATLAVTFDAKGEGVRTRPVPQKSGYVLEDQEVVCVGVPVPDTEVRIADDTGSTLGENELGEILVKGPSVFRGYFRNEEESSACRHGDWLRTGDLGFIVDEELYVAGRFKEIIVIRGENIMPHEIEWFAEDARGVTTGGERVAAFSVATESVGEEIVLVVETNDARIETLGRLEKSIRSRVGRGLSLPVSDLVFVRRGQIPRTSSGKLQRSKIKADYLRGAIDRIEL